MEIVKIGVTGHRKLRNKGSLKNELKKQIMKLNKTYELIEVISPLADGADRMVAKVLMDDYEAKLIVPLPFETDEYRKDFSEDSKKEFDNYLEQASSFYEVGSLEKNSREECYFNVGREVVNQCDILIALWDGKPAKDTGGTGDIVNDAKKEGKIILHIYAENLNEIQKMKSN